MRKQTKRVGGSTNIKLIETMYNEAALLLTRHGEARADAERLARKFILSFCQKAGGQNVYFPISLKLDVQAKHYAIKKEFRAGSSIQELMEKHKMSGSSIYEIVKKKDTGAPEKDTSIRQVLLIEAARLFTTIDLEKEDALNAAKGLTAVILARFCGLLFSLPSMEGCKIILRNIEIYRLYKAGKSICTITKQFNLSEPEITVIIESYPAPTIPGANELPILRKQLFTTTESFRAYAATNLPDSAVEVNALLEAAADQISRAEKIIAHLEGKTTHADTMQESNNKIHVKRSAT